MFFIKNFKNYVLWIFFLICVIFGIKLKYFVKKNINIFLYRVMVSVNVNKFLYKKKCVIKYVIFIFCS